MKRPWLWWWRLPPALCMAVIGFSLPNDPHAFTSPLFDHGAFLLAAVLLVIATFTPTTNFGIRVAAMGAAVLACEGRAAVILLTASELTSRQIITGLASWSMLAGAFVFGTIITDRLRTIGG